MTICMIVKCDILLLQFLMAFLLSPLLFSRPIAQDNMSKGFVSAYFPHLQNLLYIACGCEGAVWTSTEIPTLAIKAFIARQGRDFSSIVRQANFEFNNMSKAYEAFQQLSNYNQIVPYASFVQPYEKIIGEKDGVAFITMERRAADPGSKLVRLYLAQATAYKSYQGIKKLVNDQPALHRGKGNMEGLCYHAGALLGVLNLGAFVDSADVELQLEIGLQGKIPYRLTLLDFEKARPVVGNIFSEGLSRFTRIFTDNLIRYKGRYPDLLTPEFAHFRSGYLDVASCLAQDKNAPHLFLVADLIFKSYFSYHLFSTVLPLICAKTPVVGMNIPLGVLTEFFEIFAYCLVHDYVHFVYDDKALLTQHAIYSDLLNALEYMEKNPKNTREIRLAKKSAMHRGYLGQFSHFIYLFFQKKSLSKRYAEGISCRFELNHHEIAQQIKEIAQQLNVRINIRERQCR